MEEQMIDVSENQTGKKKKTGVLSAILMIVAVLIVGGGLIVGVGTYLYNDLFVVEPETFSISNMTITLTNEFEQVEDIDATSCYASDEVTVYTYKDSFIHYDYLEKYTIKQYGDELISYYEMDNPVFMNKDGLDYIEYSYEDIVSKEDCNAIIYIFKTNDAFWTVEFCVYEDDYKELKSQIIQWAKSVSFEE